MENELGELTVQDDIHIEIKKVRKQIRKMPNWKSPGPDGVQGYWVKNLSNLHNSIALQLDRCLQENNFPEWMVTGKTLLCEKNSKTKLGVKFYTNHLPTFDLEVTNKHLS